MSIKLTWRKTTSHYALLDWKGVLQKIDTPHEYANAAGAKFWYIPTLRCIQLGGDNGEEMLGSVGTPDQLHVGSVLTVDQHKELVNYLTAAVNRLIVARKEIEMAETVVDDF